MEAALSLDYDAHVQLFEFFPELEKQKALYKIIQQYKSMISDFDGFLNGLPGEQQATFRELYGV